jgi:microcystin-dependent protein
MGLTTPKLGLPYPETTDPDNVPADIKALAERLDTLSNAGTLTMPTGMITPFGGPIDKIPLGWILCDGRTADRLGQSALFAVIGTLWGGGDGTTTFNVPDLRGKFPAGAFDVRPVGEKGGAWDHSHGAGSFVSPDHLHSMAHSHWMQHSHGVSITTAGIPAVAGYNYNAAVVSGGGGNVQQAGHPHPATSGSGGTDTGNRNSTDGPSNPNTGAADRGLGVTGTSGTANPPYALVSYIIKA